MWLTRAPLFPLVIQNNGRLHVRDQGMTGCSKIRIPAGILSDTAGETASWRLTARAKNTLALIHIKSIVVKTL